ncbi:protein kinase C theta type-like [Leptodactylus fuscus]
MAATRLRDWISAILRKVPFIGYGGGGDTKREDEKKEGGKRKRGVDGESGVMKKKKRGSEKMEDGKRKRKEDGESRLMKKQRGEASILEDVKPRAGSSQDPGTSSPYPEFYINHFNIHQELGRGGFGQVVLASVPGQNTFMAVKIISKQRTNAETLMRERRILLESRDCPFLCHLYAAHQSRDRAYFIMEYLSGGSLEALLRKCGSLNNNSVRFYTAEIVCGLQFLHGRNIVHRDIKPANIILHGNGHIQIIDLGIAQEGVNSSNKIRGAKGTLRYMAPEMLLGQEYYTAVDWWSLGIVISQMSAAFSPFYYERNQWKWSTFSIINDMPQIATWLDNQTQDLIKQLLRKNPEKRLGVNSNIREHPFFNNICWEELELRRAKPPFIPSKEVLQDQHLPWPEHQSLHTVAEFSYMSPSWTQQIFHQVEAQNIDSIL